MVSALIVCITPTWLNSVRIKFEPAPNVSDKKRQQRVCSNLQAGKRIKPHEKLSTAPLPRDTHNPL